MVALKKILMHNAKEEGVSSETMFPLRCFLSLPGADDDFPLVSDYGATGDQDPEDALT